MLSGVVDRHLAGETIVEELWKMQPERVTAPYTKLSIREPAPEYRRTREIRREAGGPTPQG